MKQKRTNPAAIFSNGEEKRFLFEKKVEAHRKDFSRISLSFLLKSISVRQCAKSSTFSKNTSEAISTNFLPCFSHLDSRVPELSKVLKGVASESEKILSSSNGYSTLSWAMERAIKVAEEDTAPSFAHTILLLFKASAKVCSMENSVELRMFSSAFDGLPPRKARNFLKDLLAADSQPDICRIIGMAHSESQQNRMSTRDGLFGISGI